MIPFADLCQALDRFNGQSQEVVNDAPVLGATVMGDELPPEVAALMAEAENSNVVTGEIDTSDIMVGDADIIE